MCEERNLIKDIIFIYSLLIIGAFIISLIDGPNEGERRRVVQTMAKARDKNPVVWVETCNKCHQEIW